MGSASENIRALSDQQLIANYKLSKDKVLVGELYKRYSHLVYGMCLQYFRDRDESKDGVIRIFEKLFDELAKREVENFRGWLTFVSRNFCISELRKKKTEGKREKEFIQNEAIPENPESTGDKEIQLSRLDEAMKELNPEQKTCIELFYLQEKSYKQIVELTGYTINDVKSYIQNGKRNLKMKLNVNS